MCVSVCSCKKKTLIAPKRLGINRKKRANRFGVSMGVPSELRMIHWHSPKMNVSHTLQYSTCNEWNSRETNSEKANQTIYFNCIRQSSSAHFLFTFLSVCCLCFLLNFSKQNSNLWIIQSGWLWLAREKTSNDNSCSNNIQPPLAIIKKHKLNTLESWEEKKNKMIVAIVFYTMCEMIR